MKKPLFIFLILLTACGSNAPSILPMQNEDLIPYFTATPSQTPDANLQVVYVDTPLPTSTPSTYIINENDTLSQIAEKMGISLSDLQAANPNISPNSLSPGQELMIPAPNYSKGGTPTPAPTLVQQVICHPTADRGMWCFALLHNDFSDPIESITAQISLVNVQGQVVASKDATLPLDILPGHQSLPLMVFFEPSAELAGVLTPRVQIFTAIQLSADSGRYLSPVLQNTSVQVDWSGRSAQVNGSIALPADSKAASTVWVAAVVYDDSNRVVGVRRWETGPGLSGGGVLPFQFDVSSLAGVISRVDFVVQARP